MPSLFTFANNISTTLAGSISSGAPSLTLSSAANLPSSIPPGKVFVITLNDVATRQQFEVIYATAISGATLSGLLRGQENTSAQAWSTGDYAYCSPTMGQMQAFGQLGDNNTWSGNNAFNNPVSVGASTQDQHAVRQSQVVGVGQTLQNLTASRLFRTTYTNSTGRPIVVYVSGLTTTTNGGLSISLNGQYVAFSTDPGPVGSVVAVNALIPDGSTYLVTSTFVSLSYWQELR